MSSWLTKIMLLVSCLALLGQGISNEPEDHRNSEIEDLSQNLTIAWRKFRIEGSKTLSESYEENWSLYRKISGQYQLKSPHGTVDVVVSDTKITPVVILIDRPNLLKLTGIDREIDPTLFSAVETLDISPMVLLSIPPNEFQEIKIHITDDLLYEIHLEHRARTDQRSI